MGYQITGRGENVLSQTTTHCERLFLSPLTSFQKLLALKRYVIPRLLFQLRIRKFFRRDLGRLDARIRTLVKAEFRLPNRACQPFFHAGLAVGSLGIPNICCEADGFRVTQAVKMANAIDGSVRAVARGRLAHLARRAIRSAETTRPLTVEYLNGIVPEGSVARPPGSACELFAEMRLASRRLGVTWSLSSEGNYVVAIGPDCCVDSAKITKFIHTRVNARWRSRWEGLPDQGKTVSCQGRYGCSNDFLRTSTVLTAVESSWLLKARLNLLPLRSIRRRFTNRVEPSVVCCKCGQYNETLPHVLNHCPRVMESITNRHNSVLGVLLDFSSRHLFSRLDVDRVCREHATLTNQIQRPDLIVEDDKTVLVIDVARPFGNGVASLDEAVAWKRSKYAALCDSMRKATSKRVELHTFVVGSLGSYCPGTAATLRALGVTGHAAKLAARRAAAVARRGSHRVWKA